MTSMIAENMEQNQTLLGQNTIQHNEGRQLNQVVLIVVRQHSNKQCLYRIAIISQCTGQSSE